MPARIFLLFNCQTTGKLEDRVNRRFEKVDNTLEQMQHEINACKLDRDTVSLLVRKTDELDKRVKALENKQHKKFFMLSRNNT